MQLIGKGKKSTTVSSILNIIVVTLRSWSAATANPVRSLKNE